MNTFTPTLNMGFCRFLTEGFDKDNVVKVKYIFLLIFSFKDLELWPPLKRVWYFRNGNSPIKWQFLTGRRWLSDEWCNSMLSSHVCSSSLLALANCQHLKSHKSLLTWLRSQLTDETLDITGSIWEYFTKWGEGHRLIVTKCTDKPHKVFHKFENCPECGSSTMISFVFLHL